MKGIVKKVHKRGKAFNVCVEIDGEDTWYGAGFEVPSFPEGSLIEFGTTQNGRFTNLDTSSVKVLQNQTDQPSGNKRKSSDFDNTQASIAWQSARNGALEFVKMALDAGAVTLPQTKNKKLDAVEALLYTYTEKFYNDTEAVATGKVEDVINKQQQVEDELDDE